MPKVIIIQVIYNNRKWIEPVFTAIFNQTFKDFKVVAVIAGNEDGSKELLLEKFPQAKSRTVDEFLQNSDSDTGMEIIDPGYNIGFAKGHNLVFEKYCNLSLNPSPQKGRERVEFFQLVNPDMIMEPNYIEEMLKAFKDEAVGGATGKLYKISNSQFPIFNESKTKILDTTGVIISKSGRAYDRGQHEIDNGQYNKLVEVDAVSGAGCMYRRTALESVRLPTTHYSLNANKEFFDEDFHSYWEDVDLSWRMKNLGFKNMFVPRAVGYHGRTAGSSKNGYLDVWGFIKHHRALPLRIRQLNYQNHILMYIKNSPYFYPQFFVRELFMLCYLVIFELSVLKILPELIKLLPKVWRKRKLIYQS
jgi:GT2 family glycosyltransferase